MPDKIDCFRHSHVHDSKCHDLTLHVAGSTNRERGAHHWQCVSSVSCPVDSYPVILLEQCDKQSDYGEVTQLGQNLFWGMNPTKTSSFAAAHLWLSAVHLPVVVWSFLSTRCGCVMHGYGTLSWRSTSIYDNVMKKMRCTSAWRCLRLDLTVIQQTLSRELCNHMPSW